MANFTPIAILLLALVAGTSGRINLRRNNVAVSVGFQLAGSRLLGALTRLPFSFQYVPDDGAQVPPPPLHHHHSAGPEGGAQAHGQPGVHQHHHYHGPAGLDGVVPNSIGPEFGGFGDEVGYNEVYRR
ncbi:hypothetical protein RP20_CCG023709 [Aedes albopictus]|nr:hypothetical protein RP20_CCG023709 [Aedes albopictus]